MIDLDDDAECDVEAAISPMLARVAGKVAEQLERTSDCLCVALEDADLLRDHVGRVVGRVHVSRSLQSRSRRRFNRRVEL